MPQLLHESPNRDQQADDIIAALFPRLTQADSPLTGNAENGQTLYQTLGCFACHTLPDDATSTPTTPNRIQLNHIAAKWQPAALAAYLANPSEYYAWNPMPDFHLEPSEAHDLAAYLLKATQTNSRPMNSPQPGNPVAGQELIASLGCANCHDNPATKTTPASPSLAELAKSSADQAAGCLSKKPNATRQPTYNLSNAETLALQAFLNALNNPLLPEPQSLLTSDNPTEFTQRQFDQLRCQACHARDHETDLWSTLQNTPQTTATDLDEEELALLGSTANSVHLGRPALTHAGNKLRADWLQRFISGNLSYKPRADDPARMPGFPSQGHVLASGIAQEHGHPPTSQPLAQPDPNLAAIGQQLSLVGSGFGCVACHNVGNQKALAGSDTATINFHYITDRLLPEYYWQYLRNPQLLRPGTMMPSFINPDGTTPVTTVLEGNGQKQFDAIWNYLLTLTPDKIPTPTELRSQPPKTPTANGER